MLKAYARSSSVWPPGARGWASSTYIIVSSTRKASGAADGAAAGAARAPRRRAAGAGRTGGELCVMLVISYPPWNPAEPNRLSEANSRDPTLPGRNRFWSTCIHTNRRVSGELLV